MNSYMRLHRFSLLASSFLFACSPSGTDPDGSGGAVIGAGGDVGSGGGDMSSGGVGAGAQPGSGGNDNLPSGGSNGAGGSVGSGGDGAGAITGSGGGNASGGSEGGKDCSSLFLCDTFDDSAVGMAPNAAKWQLELGWSGNPTDADAMKIQVSSEEAHSGSNSVKVADGGNAPFAFFAAPPGETFYTRAWMKMISSAGDGTLQAVGPNHNDSEIRFRLQAGKVTLNSAGGDGLNPEPTNCTDCVATPSDWFCVEMYYDGVTESATLWIDDVQAAAVVNNTGWHSSGHFGDSAEKVWFGTFWHNGTAPVTYIDDVAIDTKRIGCGD